MKYKARVKSEYFNDQIYRRLTPMILTFILLIVSSCGSDGPFEPVSETEEEQVKMELKDRSFRQFDPSKDTSPRKGIILDFFDGLSL